MEQNSLRVADRPLREGWVSRAWSEARAAELRWVIGGGILTAALTFLAKYQEVFDQSIDLGDELVFVGISAAGATAAGFLYLLWKLVRTPFKQRDECRDELQRYLTDRVSMAIDKLDAVRLTPEATATDALLVLKIELTHGIARSSIRQRALAMVGDGAEVTELVSVFTDVGVIEIAEDMTTRPYRLSTVGKDVCWRLDVLGRHALPHTGPLPPADLDAELVRVKRLICALVDEGQSLGDQVSTPKMKSLYQRISSTITKELIVPTVEAFDAETARRIQGVSVQKQRERAQFAAALIFASEIAAGLRPEHLKASLAG